MGKGKKSFLDYFRVSDEEDEEYDEDTDDLFDEEDEDESFSFGRKKKESSEEKSFLGASEELLSRSSEPKTALGKALQDIQYQGRNEAELKARQVDLIKRIDQLEQQIFAV